ncbi:MAG TPA: endonuclease domain-containing protein [Allosphingosinicella sp.]|nr:endonuclease domain-containing protein [Allosphingosinicella sp.]
MPEVLLWHLLRTKPAGLNFRRQHPAGAYVLDFYCESAKLAVEVDGIAHSMGEVPDRDALRDRWLREAGIETLRIAARDVLDDPEATVIGIVQRCTPAPTPPPRFARSPSPPGRI